MGKSHSRLSKKEVRQIQEETYCGCCWCFSLTVKHDFFYFDFACNVFKLVTKKEIKDWHKGFKRECPKGYLNLEVRLTSIKVLASVYPLFFSKNLHVF